MIESFSCKQTEQLWLIGHSRKFSAISRAAIMKLQMLNRAESLDDLRVPPGNRLETLKGNRRGFHSIRVNNQWRICFRWTQKGPADVEIVDYH